MIREATAEQGPPLGGMAGPVLPPEGAGVARPRGEHPALNPSRPVGEFVLDAPASMTRAVMQLREAGEWHAASSLLTLADRAGTGTADALNRHRPQAVTAMELHDELASGEPHVHVHLILGTPLPAEAEETWRLAYAADVWRACLRAEVDGAGIRVCDAPTRTGWEIAPQAQPLTEPPRCVRDQQAMWPLDL